MTRARSLMKRFGISAAGPGVRAATLSGGNQQKLILARELARDPEVVLCCYPTRGLDFASTAAVHEELRLAAARGAAVVVVSIDLGELLVLASRLIVHSGRAHHRRSRGRPGDRGRAWCNARGWDRGVTSIVTASTVRNILISFVAVILAFVTAALLLAAAGQNALAVLRRNGEHRSRLDLRHRNDPDQGGPAPVAGARYCARASRRALEYRRGGAGLSRRRGGGSGRAVRAATVVPARHGARAYRGDDRWCCLGSDPGGTASLPRPQ